MTKRVLTIGVTLVALGSFAAASAWGAEYVYRVNKVPLGVGEARVVTLKSKTNQVISSSVAGLKAEVVCNKLKLDEAEEPVIQGGKPGTSARDKLEFSECEGKVEGHRCEGVTVESNHLKSEIVTVVLPATKAGQLATKFGPSNPETTFMTIKFKNCVLGLSFTVKCEGTIVMLNLPKGTEQQVGTLVAGTEQVTEIQKSTGVKEKVGLECEKRSASFVGESELELFSKVIWGVF